MVFAILFVALVWIDQVTKLLAYATDVSHVVIIPGFLEIDKMSNPLTNDLNTGMSFGIASDEPWAIPLFIAITCIALVVFLIALIKLPAKKRFLRLSIAFIMAGAAGNLIDRAVLEGVRDFIYMNLGFTSFWNNAATKSPFPSTWAMPISWRQTKRRTTAQARQTGQSKLWLRSGTSIWTK